MVLAGYGWLCLNDSCSNQGQITHDQEEDEKDGEKNQKNKKN